MDNLINRRKELVLKCIVYFVSIVLALITLYPFVMLIVDFTGFRMNNPARVLKIIPQRGLKHDLKCILLCYDCFFHYRIQVEIKKTVQQFHAYFNDVSDSCCICRIYTACL